MDDTRTVVRTNWLRFSWNQISRANKVLLVFTTLISLLQIIVTAIILGIGGRQHLSCNKPLQMYLIIFVIRVGVSLPFAIYQHLTTPRRRPRRRRQRRTRRTTTPPLSSSNSPTENVDTSENHATNDNTNASVNNTTNDDNTANDDSTTNGDNNNNGNGTTSNTQGANNVNGGEQRPATLITGWANRIKSLLDLFAILWFIVGNYLVYAPSDCAMNAGPYYYTILTFVIFGYLVMLIPVLICASVIFCLPCVLVAIRMFNINITNLMEGGSKEEIANIPLFRYKAPITTDDSSSSDTDNSPKIIHNDSANNDVRQPTASKRKFNFFKKKTSENDENADNKQYDYLTIPKPEDAVCSICLCEYEDNELICKLWCDHHYHKDCVHEWLGLNSTCPLCKQDFRGKDYQNSDEEGDSEEEQY